MRFFARIVVVATLLSCAWLAPAHAQPIHGLDVQLHQPTMAEGVSFTLDRPQSPRHLTFVGGIAFGYARSPLSRTQDGRDIDVVSHMLQGDALFAMGLFELLEIGVAMPVVAGRVADDLLNDTGSTWHAAAGDPRIAAKVTILRGDFALAARLVAGFTLGAGKYELGTRQWSVMPAVLASYRVGHFTAGAEVGYRFRRRAAVADLEVDDELQITAGANYEIVPTFFVVTQLQSRIGAGGRSFNAAENPMEVELGMRWHASPAWAVEIGAGTGVIAGYGSPLARGFAAVRYASEDTPCDAGFEDYDGFEDGDFCADLDNDGDHLNDAADECPNDAEDLDQFFDQDGCPDPDNDADGVLDAADQCPLQTEDRDGFQDEDGCPDTDDDEDGVRDGVDACRMEPEDRDQFQDDDGCPEPGPRAATVTVTGTRILISERIYFEFDRDTIRSVSMPLLDQVAAVIGDIDSSRRIRIEGHSDDQGAREYNIDLSYRRARSVVEYLVGRGVPRERLEYAGYGPDHPVVQNDSNESRSLNRRVEFTILDGAPEAPPAPSRAQRRR